MRVIRSLSIVCAAAAVAAAASTPAFAAEQPGHDWKGYAGVNCLPQSNLDPIRRSAVNQAALANTGTSPITVFCPIVRDEPEGGRARVHEVRVYFRNRHLSVRGSCEFSVHDIDGFKVATKTVDAPPNMDSTLSFGSLDTTNWGSYVLQCLVPGRDPANNNLQSYIANYRVDEISP